LADFCDRVISFIDHEADNISTLFFTRDRCTSILCAMLTYILTSISPSLAERLAQLRSSQLAYETFLVTDSFAQRVIRYVDLMNQSKLIEMLTAIYNPYMLYADQYSEDENQYLKNQVGSILRKASFERASTQLSDMTINDLEQDPYEVFVAYSENLVSTCDDSILPVIECLRRAGGYLGGLRSKTIFRSAATVVNMFIKSIANKVDDLRIACAIPPDASSSSTSHEKSSIIDESHIAESWAKKLEAYDQGSRPLLPCALRALQAVGRMLKRVKDLENIASSLLLTVHNNLSRDQSIEKAIANALSTGQSISGAYIAYTMQQDFASSSELRSFLTASTSMKASHTIFSSVNSSMMKYKVSAGMMLIDLCTGIPEKVLANLHADDVWNTKLSSDPHDESFLPQSCFTQVGEHLLSIVHELEFFASSDALPDLSSLMGESINIIPLSKGWKHLQSFLSIHEVR
jgi:hypothetical protein